MRDPQKFAIKLSHIYNNSPIRCWIISLSRNYTTSQKKSSKRHIKEHRRNVTQPVKVSKQVISANKYSRISNDSTLYLVDKNVAKKFARIVAKNRTSESPHVVEINSGLGLLTKELLDAGIPSIQMFEGIKDFLPDLSTLQDKYPGRLFLETVDFYHIWNVGYIDWKEGSNKLNYYFNRVVQRTWTAAPAMEIIGSLADTNFIFRLIQAVIFQNNFAKYGRIVVYCAVPPSVWAELTCTNQHYYLYRTRIIMFQTLFRAELLGSLPRSGFHPGFKSVGKIYVKCRRKICENDDTMMHVVKIEVKPDLFKDHFTNNDIVPFYYFVNHHLRARTNRVIPALEKWIPGCGRNLIDLGYTIFTEFGELSPQEIFNLFREFRSWPEYRGSAFISCLDSFLARMDEQIVFDTVSEELDKMFKSVNEQEDCYKKSAK